MKKHLIIGSLILGAITFITCSNTTNVEEEEVISEESSQHLIIEVIDGCEYVLSAYGGSGGVVHHAACPSKYHYK